MPKENKNTSNIFKDIKEHFLNFTNLYASAVKSGADIAGNQIIDAVEKLEKPSDITAGELVTALKGGTLNAGNKMIRSLIDYVKEVK